ncbi:hypothetical protein [Streptomyces sp. NPDC007088]|uniref:hypothetical protein n=1 Tax=Streptomyces sp. NPDC007088 TaxID=3364773 RepID=UPI0036AEC703
MAITEDLRKTLTDPTPLYFAAGTADLAVQQALRLPQFIEQVRTEAPARFEAVRATGPKEVQDRAAARAKEAQGLVQAKVTEVLGSLGSREAREAELKRIAETAQGLALRGVGLAAEYAVRAKETYDKVAEHGEKTVRTWRGEAAEDLVDVAAVVEPEAPAPFAPKVATDPDAGPDDAPAPAAAPKVATDPAEEVPAARKPGGARKAPAAKPAARRAAKPAAKPAARPAAKKDAANEGGDTVAGE